MTKKFKHSQLATNLLTGLKGIEIGGSAHNPFGLDTINVDIYPGTDTIFKQAEISICGEALPVDVVAPGDHLPFLNKSYDFVISSHVIEHFYNPIKALKEWERVARKYIFIICPHRFRTADRHRPLTTIADLQYMQNNPLKTYINKHWTVWEPSNFEEMLKYAGFKNYTIHEKDDKVGNGFTAIIDLKK